MQENETILAQSNPWIGFKNMASISYSHKDMRWAKKLQRSIEGYRIPTAIVPEDARPPKAKHLRPVFRDQTDLDAKPNLLEQLFEKIHQSRFLIVICSPNAAGSKYVPLEIERFLERDGGINHVIPFIVAGEPNSSDPEKECLPAILKEHFGNDIYMPNCADDLKFEEAFLKVVARMLAVDYTVISNRWQREQRRKMAFTAAVSVALSAVFLLITLYAILAWNYALEAQKRSESILGFMVKTLQQSDPFEKGNKDMTISQAMDKMLPGVDTEFKTDTETQTQTSLYSTIGNIYLNLGKTSQAETLYRKALDLDIARLGEKHPDVAQKQSVAFVT